MRSTLFKPADRHQFKPILAEIEDSPANPLAHVTLLLVVLTIVFFIAWSIIGQVDIVISAPGKVIPDGHAKLLQPLDTGIVSRIAVKEGDFVKKGQLLVEIDPSSTAGELESNRSNFKHTNLEIKRINSTLTGDDFSPAGDSGADETAISAQKSLYMAARAGLEKQLAGKEQELNKTADEVKQTEAQLSKDKELLALSREKEERLRPVLDLIAHDDWDKVENDIVTHRGDIEAGTHKLAELDHASGQLKEEIEKIKYDFQTQNLQDLSQKQKDATDLGGKVKELTFKHNKQALVAPVDGYIDALYVHTVGGVVTTAEKLLSIIPANIPVVIQASVSNKDIGFVDRGMPVQIKVDTFDFQKYGMFEGKVKLIAKDSHDDEKKQQPSEQEDTEKKLEQVYEVFVVPTTRTIKVEGKDQPLEPGMTLTAEIKVGKRRIIEFFLYPLIKYWHEGISVR